MALVAHGARRARRRLPHRSPAARPASSPTPPTPRRGSSRSDRERLVEALAAGIVPVVAGFQGVSTDRDVTTLGRGGSDTTAVALAAALGADRCEIYTDVSGVFSADPRVVPNARRLASISFDEMLEIAATGGQVLALRSVEFARNHHVPLHVRSSFTWEPGTWVTEEDPNMEQPIVSAVTSDTSEVKLTITGVPDHPGIAASLFRGLADELGQRRHDRAEHLARRHDRHLLHRAEARARGRDPGHRRRSARSLGAETCLDRRERRPGLGGRGGDEDQPGRHRDDVRGARQARGSTSR